MDTGSLPMKAFLKVEPEYSISTAYKFPWSKNALNWKWLQGRMKAAEIRSQKYRQCSSCDYGVLKNDCPLKKARQPVTAVK